MYFDPIDETRVFFLKCCDFNFGGLQSKWRYKSKSGLGECFKIQTQCFDKCEKVSLNIP
jgi:hypothetical protein